MYVASRPWLLRSRRRAGLLLVVTLVAAVLAAVAGATLVLVLQAPTTDLRSALRALPAASRTLEIEATGDPSAQDRAFHRLVARAFDDVPVHVRTTVRGDATTWDVSADADRITARDLDGLHAGFVALPSAAAKQFAADGGTTTRHAATVRSDSAVLASAASAVRAAAPVPISIVVIAGAVALFLTGRLLAASRVAEDRLLRARGASDARIVGLAGLEGLVTGAVGAALGSTAGTLAAAARWGVAGPATAVDLVVAAASVTVLTVGALIAAAGRGERPADARATGRSTRAAATRIGAVVLLLDLVAAVAVWRYGSPGAAAAGDPLAVVAPAALLTALAVTGALLLPPALGLVARLADRGTGFVRPVGTRLAARDGRRLAVPAALLVLAVASGVFSATVDASTRGFLQDSSRVEHGAALRADVGGAIPVNGASDLLPVGVRDRRAAEHGIRPVLRASGTTGDAAQAEGTVEVVGVDASALPAMLPVTPRTFDVQQAVHGLRRSVPGVALGTVRSGAGAALDLGVRTTVTSATTNGAPAVGVQAVAWVVDGVGDVAPLSTSTATLPTGGRPTDQTLHATLPSGGPWRLAALDLRFRGDADVRDVHLTVRSLAVAHAAVALPTRAWTAAADAFDASGLRTDDSTDAGAIAVRAPRLQFGSSSSGIRLMPAAGRVVPVLASTATGSRVGDTLTVSGSWASFRARVVGTAPTVPGTDGGAAYLADLPTLDQAVLAASQRPQRVREVWAADDGARALLVHAVPDATLSVPSTALEARFARSVVLALLAGTAAALFCAVLILAATAAAVARDRRDEALGLRTVGASASQQSRIRALGPALTGTFGLVVGLVAGIAAAGLAGVAAVRASAPRAPVGLGVPLVPAWWDVAVVVALVVVAVVVVTATHAAAVGRAAGRTGREAR
ncbi:FtsX-like permease family protein [Curtobacterium sp. L1-20]|uniref:FtsX-like permease family protein n=1 Tax=Curtobacterium sp. L1-20 TaxID=3138181 RepID=UPI003B52A50F